MSNIFQSASYITADGDEIILGMKGNRKWFEIYSRHGFGAPEIEIENREYANGAVRTLSAKLKPRECGLQMVAIGKSCRERDSIFFDMVSRLIQVGSKEEWGKLKVRRTDGIDVYLNCLYTGGMDEAIEGYKKFYRFPLEFFAGDAYFYDDKETVIRSEELATPIRLHDGLFLGKWRLNSGITDITIENTGEVLYPIIEVTGPATNIRITNNTTGKTIAIDPSYSLLSGYSIILDCRENHRGITLRNDSTGSTADISNKLALGSSLIWPFIKGTNRLSLYYTGSANSSGYEIHYQKRYLSA